MDNTPTVLSAIKTALYALLVALLAVLTLVLYEHNGRNRFAPKTSEGWCGNRSVLNSKQQRGHDLFIANCAACHNKNMRDDLTGPALHSTEANWAAYPRQALYDYIRHSQASLKTKQPRAVALWKKWQPTLMNDFPNLTDDDIEAILAYIQEASR